MIFGYIRVSTCHQSTDTQRLEIERFCKENNLKIDEWIDETASGQKRPNLRKIKKIMEKAKSGDLVICTEISRLGRSLIMIMNILQHFLEKEVRVWTIKDNFRLGDDIQSKVLAFAFGLSAEIEHKLISLRTTQGLERARLAGKRIGRPKGRISSYYKLSSYDDYIKKEMLLGKTKKSLAKELGVTWKTLNCHLSRIFFAESKMLQN